MLVRKGIIELVNSDGHTVLLPQILSARELKLCVVS